MTMTPQPGEEPGRPVSIDGRTLSLEDVAAVARGRARARLAPDALPAIEASLAVVRRIAASGEIAYGITTGFGALSDQPISPAETAQLQLNLVRSHAAGAGEPLPAEAVRAAMLLRANSLARGLSGARPLVIEALLALLNTGCHPVVPEHGSLGASGDLAPLAHVAAALVGLGQVEIDGERWPAATALKVAGVERLALGPKEALALVNGTPFMAGLACLALLDAERLLDSAVAVAALSAFALGAHRAAYHAAIHEARPHPGQVEVAARLRSLLDQAGATPGASRRPQDPYSLRCVPQVYGAIAGALAPIRRTLEIEINAATDNPLIFPDDGAVLSGGNFHGHPLALGCDSLKTAVASLGTIVERRVNLLVDGGEHGLPRFLVPEPGLHSGYMIAHYLCAGLVSENRVLAHPASIDSIPVSANVEDYNSMGMTAARHARRVVENVERIVAVEALCAAQACDLTERRPRGPLGELHGRIRQAIPPLDRDDRVVAGDIERAVALLRGGALRAPAGMAAG